MIGRMTAVAMVGRGRCHVASSSFVVSVVAVLIRVTNPLLVAPVHHGISLLAATEFVVGIHVMQIRFTPATFRW